MSGVLIVTGASRGIGAATAKLAAQAGYDVAVNYLSNKDAASAVVAEIEAAGGKAFAVQADVGTAQGIETLFEAVDARGKLAGLVNNAGVVDSKTRVDEMDEARLERMMRTNVIGPVLCAGEAVKRLSTRHSGTGGVIVNVSSVAARIGSAGEYVDYAASKAAIDTFTIGLANEVATEGIRVVAVRPGIIDTDIHASGGQPDRIERVRGNVPMRREGKAEEVARTIVWLLSDEASYITGTLVDVSGGR
ncbi:SDR family oxidoreductase [Mesorhizobium sp. SB112]|uniref:SDR family oxidoreductase n=1 Tax=Mesorhizobium sp. SB112 TaxID=3151853 RepID=UPI00326626F5